jgi:hypothetical protein
MLALGAALSGPPCFAQTSEELAAARLFFNEGKDLEKYREWAAALEKFKKVAFVKMTPQVRFHLALCEENLGKLVSAMQGFALAAEEAKKAGSIAVEVAAKAPARAEALRKRIATLKIDVAGRVVESSIVLDGAKVAAASFGAEIPVDPGAHVVEVVAPSGKSTFRKELMLAEQAWEQVHVEVDDSSARPLPPLPPPAPALPPSRLPAYIVGGAALFVLAGSAVFYGLEVNAINTVRGNAHCDEHDHNCDGAYESTGNRGKTYSVISNVSLGVGLAGVATAGVLWFVRAPKKQEPQRAALTVSPLDRGVAIRGVF